MSNPCQEPTPYQSAMKELSDTLEWQREQLREAVRLIYECEPRLESGPLLDSVKAFLDQHSDIVKDLNGGVKS